MIHLVIRFGSLERDYSLSSFNLTGLVHDSLFCYLLLLLYLSSMIHFFHSPFLLYHSTLLHDSDFEFHLPLCMYCLPIFYKSNLRMSIGYLQPLVLYVHEHDRLGSGMLTMETAVILGLYLIAFVDILVVPIATEKVSRIRSNIVWNRWKSTLRARSI